MFIAIVVVLFNFILIQIFASTYYGIYFLALLLYLYFFSFKSNILYIIIITMCVFFFKYYFDEDIYDIYIWIDSSIKFFYIDEILLFTLTFLHILFLFLVSSYENLKKMSYN